MTAPVTTKPQFASRPEAGDEMSTDHRAKVGSEAASGPGDLPAMLETDQELPAIPVMETGAGFPLATLLAHEQRAHALLDIATHGVPARVLRTLDRVSRQWLVRHANAHLEEIDAIAHRLGRPGAYFLSVNYEWGCTCRVAPAPDGRSARLIRVLDWRTPGLGRNIMAARVEGACGRFTTLTWPGYTGVLQGIAPQRFAAALNQAPMRMAGGGLMPLDWALNKGRVWRMPHRTPAHLLRDVFEQAADFPTARRMLIDTPIASPAIFSVAGVGPGQTCVIERTELAAHEHDGPGIAANNWQAPGWRGRARGNDSAGRACRMATVSSAFDPALDWLSSPILNPRTRLVMIADASSGRFIARGYEADGPATSLIDMVA